MSSIPQYSPQAILALAHLKRAENDVDVFVEDSAHPAAWAALVRSGLKPGVKLASVTAIGTREAVVAVCRADQSAGGRRRLYIIDRDLDDLVGKSGPKLKRLYRLERCCFENLLLHDEAHIDIGVACGVTKTDAQIRADCNFTAWYSDVLSRLRPLCYMFGAMQSLGSGRVAAGCGIGPLITQHGRNIALDSKKIASAIIRLGRQLSLDFTYPVAKQALRDVRTRAAPISSHAFVSGKHFLFPLFAIHFRKAVPFRGSNDELMVHLARKFDTSIDTGLFRRLRRL